MNGKATRRTRHEFRPGVDSLEDRLVLSPGGAIRAAQLEQLHEHRNLVRAQRIEHRQLRHLGRHHRVGASTPATAATTINTGTANSAAQQDSRDAALLASAQSTSWMQSIAAANRNPNQVPISQVGSTSGTNGRIFGSSGVVTSSGAVISNDQTSRTVSAGGSGVNSTVGTLNSSQFVPDTLARVGATQNGTTSAITTPVNNTTTGTGTLFNNISTTPGTATTVAGTVFNNNGITPGTVSSASGLINNGTATLLNNGATTLVNNAGTASATGTTIPGVNSGAVVQATTGSNVGASATNPFGARNSTTTLTGTTTTTPAVVNTTPAVVNTTPAVISITPAVAGTTPAVISTTPAVNMTPQILI